MNTPPVAEIRSKSSTLHEVFGGSRLWALTILCLLIAGSLMWWSSPQRGTTIHIKFPEGHGLQPEDTVRYRGIEVGIVESVHLDESLEGVEVEVLLKPTADELAVEGTRYWIVRPELSLTRISGLETAIGHKYIGVSPSKTEDSQAAYNFQGLADVPVDTLSDSGVELILRGDKKYSVSKGSSVTFRGVEVGTVLDVALSQEAQHVDVRVRIFDQHASLLTSESKFWASSGIDFDFSFGFNGGFNLDTESLETLARGGVSMITTGQGKEVSPGDIFTLHASADDKWFEEAGEFVKTSVPLRGAVPIRISWKSKGFFGKKQKSAQFNGVAVLENTQQMVIFPADIVAELADEELTDVLIGSKAIDLEDFKASYNEGSLACRLDIESSSEPFVIDSDVEVADSAIDCLALRNTGNDGIKLHLSVPAGSIKPAENKPEVWDVIDFNGDRNVWHGSPVISSQNGKPIGILLITDSQTRIVRWSELAP